MTGTPSLEERAAALEATVAMLTRKLFERGDITINDARSVTSATGGQALRLSAGPTRTSCDACADKNYGRAHRRWLVP